jgi:MFS family permease
MRAMRLGRYREVLGAPGVARLALFTTIGRLPFGILPFALVLLMREESYGYGEVGAVLAAEALAVGVTAAFVGRLIDRAGQTRVILVTGAITAAAIVGDVLAILEHAPTAWVVAISVVQGATVPPISASMRALWSRLVPERLVDSAYALDAIQLELIFVVGPLITAGVASAWTPAAALLLCAALYASAAVGFALSPASRAAAPDRDAARTRLGALGAPGMRTLISAASVTAISFGVLEVGLPAFAESEGSPALAGLLITAWSIGSLAGGLWYGAREWRMPGGQRAILLTGALALGSAPLAFAGSLELMAVLLIGTGFALAPLGATTATLISRIAPAGTATEAYSWQIVANVVGAATGSLLAGLLVEHASVSWALGSAALACAGGFSILVARRRTLGTS